ncbi:MAG: arsenosugar biosynthesis radical SAM protein ArsS [Myxococcota bacterium]|nr:arsenosugar biosynthesis radical SAM protein ArsS [Myxococcota bacterium]
MTTPVPAFDARLRSEGLAPLRRGPVTTLQVNVGLRCDLACHHCHVEAGPKRREALDAEGAGHVLRVLAESPDTTTLDLTGGAPELNPEFRRLVIGARRLGRRVIDRCNLTVLFQPGQEDTAEFLAEQGVDVIASLPCYTADNVDAQRGKDVFRRSIEGLQRLNALGYGGPSGPRLHLVYNPQGASLPPPQAELEADYRTRLAADFGIRFDGLLTITNMPIKRFARQLHREGEYEAYLSLLVSHFNPAAVPDLMCRETLSVAWDGSLYDCDFNQALGLPRPVAGSLADLKSLSDLEGQPIRVGEHCFGCTAGAGSSCGGALLA